MEELNRKSGVEFDELVQNLEQGLDVSKLLDLDTHYSHNYPDRPSARAPNPPMIAGPSPLRAEQSRLETEQGKPVQDTERAGSRIKYIVKSSTSQTGGKNKRKNKTKKRKNKRKRRTKKKNLFFYFK